MITRIVKLTIKKEHAERFKRAYAQIEEKITGHAGCLSLKLLQDKDDPGIFFTLSHWKSEEHLNSYRNSDFFKQMWPEVRLLFAERPEVWSCNEYNKHA